MHEIWVTTHVVRLKVFRLKVEGIRTEVKGLRTGLVHSPQHLVLICDLAFC